MFINNLYEALEFDHGYSINMSYCVSPVTFPMHWHSYIEVIAPLYDGNEIIINNVSHVMAKEDLAIVFPGELHSISSVGTHPSIILQFSPSLLTILIDFNNNLSLFNQFQIITAAQAPLPAHQLLNTLTKMKDLYYSNIRFKEAALYSKLLKFFSIFGEYCIDNSERFHKTHLGYGKNYTEKFAEICTYISENSSQDLTLDSVAKYAGFSRFHFSRLFKQFTETPFLEFVTIQKIKKAERLLANPTLPITEVAYQSGFCSLSTFNRTFKKHKNCTPREFRTLYTTHIPSKTP